MTGRKKPGIAHEAATASASSAEGESIRPNGTRLPER